MSDWRAGGDGARGEWGGELGRYLIRHGSIFVRAAVLIALTVVVSNLLVSEWLERNLLVYARQCIAGAAAWLFDLMGFEVTRGADELHLSGATIKIVNTCIGFDAGLFLGAAVSVFPTTWRARAGGVALVFGAMVGVNFLRVLSLSYLLTASRSLFDFFHYYLWPALIVMTCLAVLLLWVRHLTSRGEAHRAGAGGRAAVSAGIAIARRVPPLSHAWIAQLLLRFAVAYGAAFFLSVHAPVIEAVEVAGVWILDLGFRVTSSAEATRSLEFVHEEGSWSYVYDVRLGTERREMSEPFHAHGFVVLLYLSLVLATPGLGWRRGLKSLAAGGGLVFALCVALLMSDLQAWELAAFAGDAAALAAGPFPAGIRFVDALHRTAAPALLPVCLWVLVLTHDKMRQPRAEAS